jgi:hypothetical protein
MAFSTEIREDRAFAAEIKFFVPADRVEALRCWARARLGPDPHGSGPYGDTYDTSSLYFDTQQFDVYHRRGSYGRSKYRVRRYGLASELFFERKLKTRDLVSKRRSIVDIRELPRLGSLEPRKGWAGHWFHRRILARDLELVCQVSYSRTALLHSNGDGPMRLTLDEDVRAAQSHELVFRNLPHSHALTAGSAILELKYYHTPPAVFQELIAEFSLAAQPISKYRMSVAALHIAEAAQAKEVTI